MKKERKRRGQEAQLGRRGRCESGKPDWRRYKGEEASGGLRNARSWKIQHSARWRRGR